jgi:energy-converting hydrogenase Eha subunit F
VARLNQQAERMQYPQFRKKLLEIAADETKHTEWLAEDKDLGWKTAGHSAGSRIDEEQYLLEDLTAVSRGFRNTGGDNRSSPQH